MYASNGGPSKYCAASLWGALTSLGVGSSSAATLSVCTAFTAVFSTGSSSIDEVGAGFTDSSSCEASRSSAVV